MAKWYKETIQNGLLDAVYTNKNKVAGVNLNDPSVKEQIYERYLKAYKKGAFNYIKETPTSDGQVVPRKYFSGGFTEMGMDVKRDGAMSAVKSDGAMLRFIVLLEECRDIPPLQDGNYHKEIVGNYQWVEMNQYWVKKDGSITFSEKDGLRDGLRGVMQGYWKRIHRPDSAMLGQKTPKQQTPDAAMKAKIAAWEFIGNADEIEKIILNDEETSVRKLAAEALGRMRHKTSIPALIYALAHDKNEGVRLYIAEALEKIGESDEEKMFNSYMVKLASVDPEVRADVEKRLAESGNPRAGEVLKEMLEDPDRKVLLAAIEGIRKLHYEPARPLLIEFEIQEEGTDDVVFRAAKEALAELDRKPQQGTPQDAAMSGQNPTIPTEEELDPNAKGLARLFIDMHRNVPLEEMNKMMREKNVTGPLFIQALRYFLSSSVERDQVRAAALIYTLYLDSKEESRRDYLQKAYKEARRVIDILNGEQVDKAALAKDLGGIDLNPINVKRSGKTVTVQFDPAQLNELMQGGFEGFTPVIINITPIQSPFQLLGINPAKQPEALAKV